MVYVEKRLLKTIRATPSPEKYSIDIFVKPGYSNGKASEWLLNIPNILKEVRYQEHDDASKIVTFGEMEINDKQGLIIDSSSGRKVRIPNLESAIVSIYNSDLMADTPHTAGVQIIQRIIQEDDIMKILSNTNDKSNSMYRTSKVSSSSTCEEVYNILRKIKDIR